MGLSRHLKAEGVKLANCGSARSNEWVGEGVRVCPKKIHLRALSIPTFFFTASNI